MGAKNKGGREARKPKASKKPKGVLPATAIVPPSIKPKDQPAK